MADIELMIRIDEDYVKIINKNDASNYPEEVIKNGTPPIPDSEIVKPYLEKLKAKMQERDEDNGGEPLNAVDKGYHLACEHLFKEIDNLLKGEAE